jgi:Plasmid encoded RepA protein
MINDKAEQTKPRNYAQERTRAISKRALDVAEIRESRNSGSLGDEVFKLAQAMILCTLPYRPTTEVKITRKARLGDGSTLIVTFMAARDGVPMAYGSDRKLLTWMFDKAIQSDSPFVPWKKATEYSKETGINDSGKNLRDLRERFRRLSGLVISIERRTAAGEKGKTVPVIEEFNLPPSVAYMEAEEQGQGRLPELAEIYGFKLNESLWKDIKRHNVAIPRELWLRTKGSAQLQDILLWMFYRCYSAQTESVVPWDGIRQQLPQDDSNPWRLKQLVKTAVKELRLIWPEARVEVVKEGLLVNRALAGMLPDDDQMNRRRRLGAPSSDRTSA